MAKPKIVFICPGDASRSLIAQGFARYYAGRMVDVRSASLDPKPPSDYILWGMNEVSVDISDEKAVPANSLRLQDFDYVVTLSDGGTMPLGAAGPKTHVENWDVADPSHVRGQTPDLIRAIRVIRYQIEQNVQELLKKVLAR